MGYLQEEQVLQMAVLSIESHHLIWKGGNDSWQGHSMNETDLLTIAKSLWLDQRVKVYTTDQPWMPPPSLL